MSGARTSCPARRPTATTGRIGPEERSYIRILSSFAHRIGPGATVAVTSPSAGLRSYGLSVGGQIDAYVVNAQTRTTPTAGGRLTIVSPVRGTVTFVCPATGPPWARPRSNRGRNTLTLPQFTTDVAVRIAF